MKPDFYPRDAMRTAGVCDSDVSVRLSVCPSVTADIVWQAVLSQRWPRNAPSIRVPWKFSVGSDPNRNRIPNL